MMTRKEVRRAIVASLGILAWLGGCSSSSTEGITVSVDIEAPAEPPASASTRLFESDRGLRIVLTRGYLTTGSVEILACSAAPSSRAWWQPFRMREVHAHVVGSPTLLGVPNVESLLAASETTTRAGELHPPPGSYCKVKQTILAADGDAIGLPADGSMLGKSMLVEGTYQADGSSPRAFQLSSTASFDVELTIPETKLSTDGRRAARVLLVKTDAHWFDGVDFDADESESATRVLQNLRAALGARVE
ncbi:hypothetical protein [Labilithrix luteola]|uniref:hypothetical protein n=1 Tax=Labilithrix luteola TaxID=1391654 RepID=UPI001969BC5F|nr:hypothetical protein [Labilithrix luteola]